MHKIKKIFKRMLIVIITVVFILLICSFIYTIISRITGNPMPQIFGWGQAVVLSGSMEPDIPVGALIYIKKQSSYAPDDIVTYNDGKSLVTHRLVSISDGIVVTKGDANNTTDNPFNESEILGKVRGVVPGIGKFIVELKKPANIIYIILIGALIIFSYNIVNRKVEN